MIPSHLHFALFITFLTLFLKLPDLEARVDVTKNKKVCVFIETEGSALFFKRPEVDSIPSQMNPFHIFTAGFPKIHFKIIILSTSKSEPG
jgi:hypothetical protein